MKRLRDYFLTSESSFKTLLLFLLISFAVFWPSYTNPNFFWDDERFIFLNPSLLQSKSIWSFWNPNSDFFKSWPLGYSSFWLLLKYFPSAGIYFYKSLNIFFHGLNCFFVYHIVKKFKFPYPILLATIFLIHPLQVETVSWIFQLLSLLAFFFFIISFTFILKYIEEKRGIYIVLSFLFYIASLCTKSFSVLAPLLFILIFFINNLPPKKYLVIIPFFIFGGLIGIFSIRGTDATLKTKPNTMMSYLNNKIEKNFSISGEKLKETDNKQYFDLVFKTKSKEDVEIDLGKVHSQAPWHYLTKIFFPYQLHFIYPVISYPFVLNLMACVILFIIPILLTYLSKEKSWTLVPALSLVFILPFLGITKITFFYWSNVADRYCYFFILALVFALGSVLKKYHSPIVQKIVIVYLIILSALNIDYGLKFNEPRRLYEEILVYKKHPAIYSLLIEQYLKTSHFKEASHILREGIKLFPNDPSLQIDKIHLDNFEKILIEN